MHHAASGHGKAEPSPGSTRSRVTGLVETAAWRKCARRDAPRLELPPFPTPHIRARSGVRTVLSAGQCRYDVATQRKRRLPPPHSTAWGGRMCSLPRTANPTPNMRAAQWLAPAGPEATHRTLARLRQRPEHPRALRLRLLLLAMVDTLSVRQSDLRW